MRKGSNTAEMGVKTMEEAPKLIKRRCRGKSTMNRAAVTMIQANRQVGRRKKIYLARSLNYSWKIEKNQTKSQYSSKLIHYHYINSMRNDFPLKSLWSEFFWRVFEAAQYVADIRPFNWAPRELWLLWHFLRNSFVVWSFWPRARSRLFGAEFKTLYSIIHLKGNVLPP